MFTEFNLKEYLKELFKDSYENFIMSKDEPPAIRINTLKSGDFETDNFLKEKHIIYRKHFLSATGRILNDDPLPLSHTLQYFTGKFCYQGVSSQIPVEVLQPEPGEKVIDLCAAPGSKSTQIAAKMNNKGLLVVNDINTQRLKSLSVNLHRMGVLNSQTTNYPAQRIGNLLPEYFDKVLADVPCMALKYMPENPQDAELFFRKKFKRINATQEAILISAVKAARVNGIIVYSTCSLTPEENELLISSIISKYPVCLEKITVSYPGIEQGLTTYKQDRLNPELKKTLRINPFNNSCEGFFVARLRKTASVKNFDSYAEKENDTTLDFNDRKIKDVFSSADRNWQIDHKFFSQFRYRISSRKVWMMSKVFRNFPLKTELFSGFPLFRKSFMGWHPGNSAIQMFPDHIKGDEIEIDDQLLKKLFRSGKVKIDYFADGHYTLKRDGTILGVAACLEGTLKIKLPHLFKLVL